MGGGQKKTKKSVHKQKQKQKKKKDPNGVEAKKRHVQKLAREGKWDKIEEKYGSKMVIKARTYAEKLQSRPQATVQSLARDILEKNGYGKYSHEDECSTNDKNKNESTAATEKRSETTKQQTERKGNSGTTQKTLGQEVHTLTEKQKKAIEAKRLAALARRQQHLISLSANHQKEKVIPAVNSTRTCGSNPRQQQYHIISPVEKIEIRSEAPRHFTHVQHKFSGCTRLQKPSTISRPFVIEDELKAAAEVIKWELEQEQSTNTPHSSFSNMSVIRNRTSEIIPIEDSDNFSSTPDFQILPPPEVLTSNMNSRTNAIEQVECTSLKAAKRPSSDCTREASISTELKPIDKETTQRQVDQLQVEKLIKELLLPDSCFDTSVLEFVDVVLP